MTLTFDLERQHWWRRAGLSSTNIQLSSDCLAWFLFNFVMCVKSETVSRREPPISQKKMSITMAPLHYYLAAWNADAGKCVICDKMKEKSIQIFILFERSFSL